MYISFSFPRSPFRLVSFARKFRLDAWPLIALARCLWHGVFRVMVRYDTRTIACCSPFASKNFRRDSNPVDRVGGNLILGKINCSKFFRTFFFLFSFPLFCSFCCRYSGDEENGVRSSHFPPTRVMHVMNFGANFRID